MGNPEDHVLDAIAELVEESIAHGPTDDYNRPYQERCELCGMAWHGLESSWGCPGAHATPEEQQRFRERIGWWSPWKWPEDPFDPADWGPGPELPPSMQFPRLGGVDFTAIIGGFAELRERMHAWLVDEGVRVEARTWLPGDPLP